jgi:hypothetical protein
MGRQKPAVDTAPHSEEKLHDSKVDTAVSHGYDPFNGEVYLFKDTEGYWLENWRTDHYSDYLHDEKGNLITGEDQALACLDNEIANAHFNSPVYP